MRILIISTFFPPLNSIASLRAYSWAKFWTLEGHDVTVLTTQKEKHQTLDLQLTNPGFEVIEVPLPNWIQSFKGKQKGKEDNKKRSGFSRFLHYLRRKKGVFHACRMPDFTDLWVRPAIEAVRSLDKWDLVVSTSGPYAVHIVGNRLKKLGKAKAWIADFRDRWSDNHIFPGLFPFNLIEKGLEKRLMKNADHITTVSAPYSEPFIKKYGKDRVHIIENGFDIDDISNLPKIPIFLDNKKFRIVHTGSFFRRRHNPSPLFQAIRNMSEDSKTMSLLNNLEVIFVGTELESLEKMIEEYGVGEWVKTFGFVNREVSLRMQQDAHALLFFPWNDLHVDGVLSGKIFEYLFSKTPVIAVGGEQIEASQKLLLDSKAGIILATIEECEGYLVEKLNGITKEKTSVSQDFLEKYSRKNLSLKMLEIYPVQGIDRIEINNP